MGISIDGLLGNMPCRPRDVFLGTTLALACAAFCIRVVFSLHLFHMLASSTHHCVDLLWHSSSSSNSSIGQNRAWTHPAARECGRHAIEGTRISNPSITPPPPSPLQPLQSPDWPTQAVRRFNLRTKKVRRLTHCPPITSNTLSIVLIRCRSSGTRS